MSIFTWLTRRRVRDRLSRMMDNLRAQERALSKVFNFMLFYGGGMERRQEELLRAKAPQVDLVYFGGLFAVHDGVTIELNKYVGSFTRMEPRSLEWYQRAAERYAANLARRFDWVYQTPTVELVRVMGTIYGLAYQLGKFVEMAKCVIVAFRAADNSGSKERLLSPRLKEAALKIPVWNAYWDTLLTDGPSSFGRVRHFPTKDDIPPMAERDRSGDW